MEEITVYQAYCGKIGVKKEILCNLHYYILLERSLNWKLITIYKFILEAKGVSAFRYSLLSVWEGSCKMCTKHFSGVLVVFP